MSNTGHRRLLLSACILFTAINGFSQSEMDSLSGKVKTYFTPGYSQEAAAYQQTLTDALLYFEEILDLEFSGYELRVLDESQFTGTYGFLKNYGREIVVPARITLKDFPSVYGISQLLSDDPDNGLNTVLDLRTLQAFYSFYTIHELGHSLEDNFDVSTENWSWLKETVATYIAYHYIRQSYPDLYRSFQDLNTYIIVNHEPEFGTMLDFAEWNMHMPIADYLWFQCQFWLLAEQLYDCYGPELLNLLSDTNLGYGTLSKMPLHKTIELLDSNCPNTASNWVLQLENREP